MTCDTSIYVMDHNGFIVSYLMENSIGVKWVKYENILSYDVAFGIDMTPCIKIDKPLVVY